MLLSYTLKNGYDNKFYSIMFFYQKWKFWVLKRYKGVATLLKVDKSIDLAIWVIVACMTCVLF
jgi:hypothetical protein